MVSSIIATRETASPWSLSDAVLVDMGMTELDRDEESLPPAFHLGFVVRRINAYPMYSLLYTEALDT